MVELVTQYFLSHHEIQLPGIGSLSYTELPSKYDSARQLLLPPRFQFTWKPAEEVSFSLQPLIGYISKHSGQPEEECYETLQEWSAGVKDILRINGEWKWDGLGKLVMISGTTIGFVPDAALEDYEPALPATRAIHEGWNHTLTVGDTETSTTEMQKFLSDEEESTVEGRWWLPALVIGVLAIAIIAARILGWL